MNAILISILLTIVLLTCCAAYLKKVWRNDKPKWQVLLEHVTDFFKVIIVEIKTKKIPVVLDAAIVIAFLFSGLLMIIRGLVFIGDINYHVILLGLSCCILSMFGYRWSMSYCRHLF